MKLTIALIRNGKTSGGISEHLSVKDEPLLEKEKNRLTTDREKYPVAPIIFTSPLLRCRQTASILYPYTPTILLNQLRSFDAGIFSGKTYGQLVCDKRFIRWAESEQLLQCPEGESLYTFSARCMQGFRMVVSEMNSKGIEIAALVAHSLTINIIMQRFCIPRSIYHNWTTEYGGGYVIEFDSASCAAKVQQVL